MALRRGIPSRVVEIFESLTLSLTIDGELYFRIIVLLAIIGAILMTAFLTLGAVLYNLIADLVGGVEFAVLEETYSPMATRTTISSAVDPATPTNLAAHQAPSVAASSHENPVESLQPFSTSKGEESSGAEPSTESNI